MWYHYVGLLLVLLGTIIALHAVPLRNNITYDIDVLIWRKLDAVVKVRRHVDGPRRLCGLSFTAEFRDLCSQKRRRRSVLTSFMKHCCSNGCTKTEIAQFCQGLQLRN
ncbi:hypothetical protein L596_010560 [Steinernema carpocapsae]|uniref:Insulin-like domain-containing protein n=1 Tax=Steinernema carpocapsae TaxID=34508 RepID=A0A4U5PIU6_STECR|nr:hypothetical protein L596_010560 [Steinernema carpocapsae]